MSDLGTQRTPPKSANQKAATNARQGFAGSRTGAVRNAQPLATVKDSPNSENASTTGVAGQIEVINWFEDVFSIDDDTFDDEAITGFTLSYIPIAFSEIVHLNGVMLRRGPQFYTGLKSDDPTLAIVQTLGDALTGYPQGKPWELRCEYAYYSYISSVTTGSSPVSAPDIGNLPPVDYPGPGSGFGGAPPGLITDWKKIILRLTTNLDAASLGLTSIDSHLFPGTRLGHKTTFVGGTLNGVVLDGGIMNAGAQISTVGGESKLKAMISRYSTATDAFTDPTVEVFYRDTDPVSGSVTLDDPYDSGSDYIGSVVFFWEDHTVGGTHYPDGQSQVCYPLLLGWKFSLPFSEGRLQLGLEIGNGTFNAGEVTGLDQPLDWSATVGPGRTAQSSDATDPSDLSTTHQIRLTYTGTGTDEGVGTFSIVPCLIHDSGAPIPQPAITAYDASTVADYDSVSPGGITKGLVDPHDISNEWLQYNWAGIGFRLDTDPVNYVRWGPFPFSYKPITNVGTLQEGRWSGVSAVPNGTLAWDIGLSDGVALAAGSTMDLTWDDPGNFLVLSGLFGQTIGKNGRLAGWGEVGDELFVSTVTSPVSYHGLLSGNDLLGSPGGAIDYIALGPTIGLLMTMNFSYIDVSTGHTTNIVINLNRRLEDWDFFTATDGLVLYHGQNDFGKLIDDNTTYECAWKIWVDQSILSSTHSLRFKMTPITSGDMPAILAEDGLDIVLLSSDGIEFTVATGIQPDGSDGRGIVSIAGPNNQTSSGYPNPTYGIDTPWSINPMYIGFRLSHTDSYFEEIPEGFGPYAFLDPLIVNFASGLLDAATETSGETGTSGLDGLVFYQNIDDIQHLSSQSKGVTSLDTSSLAVSSLLGENVWGLNFTWLGDGGPDDPKIADITVIQNHTEVASAASARAFSDVYAYARFVANRQHANMKISGFSASITGLDGTIDGGGYIDLDGSDPAIPGDENNVPTESGDFGTGSFGGGDF